MIRSPRVIRAKTLEATGRSLATDHAVMLRVVDRQREKDRDRALTCEQRQSDPSKGRAKRYIDCRLQCQCAQDCIVHSPGRQSFTCQPRALHAPAAVPGEHEGAANKVHKWFVEPRGAGVERRPDIWVVHAQVHDREMRIRDEQHEGLRDSAFERSAPVHQLMRRADSHGATRDADHDRDHCDRHRPFGRRRNQP